MVDGIHDGLSSNESSMPLIQRRRQVLVGLASHLDLD
jgi:hypothetical protein